MPAVPAKDATAEPRASGNEFDREISDMADYIHNYQLKSPLAVSRS